MFRFRSSSFNLNGSGKVSKANKRKRSDDRELVRSGNSKKLLKCTDELMNWYVTQTIYDELEKRNTHQLKCVCEENGIKRSGAKYEITAAIRAHVEGYFKQQEKLKLASAAQDKAGGGVATTRLEVLNIKSLETVESYCKKFQAQKLDKEKSFDKKVDMICGLTQGTKDQVLTAVTGPKRNKYNGKHGELAEDLLDYLGKDLWLEFFKTHKDRMSIQQFQQCINCMAEKHECEDYGHANVLARVGDDILDFIENDEFQTFLSEKLDSICQYGRPKKNKKAKCIDSIEADRPKDGISTAQKESGYSSAFQKLFKTPLAVSNKENETAVVNNIENETIVVVNIKDNESDVVDLTSC